MICHRDIHLLKYLFKNEGDCDRRRGWTGCGRGRSEDRIYFSFLLKSASAAMGAWKCSFPLFFYEIMTGRPINQQQRADMRCPRKVTLPIKNIKN